MGSGGGEATGRELCGFCGELAAAAKRACAGAAGCAETSTDRVCGCAVKDASACCPGKSRSRHS